MLLLLLLLIGRCSAGNEFLDTLSLSQRTAVFGGNLSVCEKKALLLVWWQRLA